MRQYAIVLTMWTTKLEALLTTYEVNFTLYSRDDCERPSLNQLKHLILLRYLDDAIRCFVSADLKMIISNLYQTIRLDF